MPHGSKRESNAANSRAAAQGIGSPSLFFLLAAVSGLAATSLYSYLLFHVSVEMARAIVLLSVSGLAWASWRVMENGYLVVYGSASFFAAIIALLHTLTYKGMAVFPVDNANLPTQLWIASRYLESTAFVLAAFFTGRKLEPAWPVASFAAASALLLGAILGGIFPDCFVEGKGLTPFKVVSEYLVAGAYVAALYLLLKRRDRFEPYVLQLLAASIACSIVAELAFTLYVSVFGAANMVGHLFVFAAAYLAYWTILVVGVRRPQELLFRELSQREDMLAQRVMERTRQLEDANWTLARENAARRQAEEELTRLNAGLEQKVAEQLAKNREKDVLLIQQSRLATMGEMLRNIAHQWRQPLSVMSILLANIKDAYEQDELDAQTLNELINEGEKLTRRMSATIDDFKDFFRGDQDMAPFDLAKAVRLALSIVGDTFESEQIEISLAEVEQPQVFGYANEFSRILLNLLSNAQEAIRRRGDGGNIRLEVRRDGDRGIVSIRDTGGGIPADILPKIFDPYFSTKESGTGLGLYMAKKVLDNMGGRIEGRNVEGGAEFTVSVPLAK